MPYRISKEGDKYVVRKQWTGKKVAEHDTLEKAKAQIRAIYLHEKGK
jgi:hypothetical protein